MYLKSASIEKYKIILFIQGKILCLNPATCSKFEDLLLVQEIRILHYIFTLLYQLFSLEIQYIDSIVLSQYYRCTIMYYLFSQTYYYQQTFLSFAWRSLNCSHLLLKLKLTLPCYNLIDELKSFIYPGLSVEVYKFLFHMVICKVPTAISRNGFRMIF